MVDSTKGVSKELPLGKEQQKNLTDTGSHESLPITEIPLHVLSKQEVGKVQERQSPDTKDVALKSCQDGRELMTKMEKASNNSQLTESLDRKGQAPLSNQESNSQHMVPKKEMDDIVQKSSPDNEVLASRSNQEGCSLSVKLDEESDYVMKRPSPDSGINSSVFNGEGTTLSITPQKVLPTLQQTQGLDVNLHALDSDQGKYTLTIRPDKVLDKLPLRRNPDTATHALQSDQEEITLSKVPEKPTVDGYNWRKYGQKLVRGNTFIRSYYKCTFPNCPARKQVERSHDGRITEINYLWKHEHPKPPPHTLLKGTAILPIQAKLPDETSLTKSEDETSVHGVTSCDTEAREIHQLSIIPASDKFVEVAVSKASEVKSEVNDDGEPDSKKQKRDLSSANDGVVTKTNCEPRVVVHTTSEVDIVNDGYRWRKYGQKLVKGNPNPRSYYRCSSAGCPVKKHVERASHDQKVVITTYEGRHDHDMPGTRTVTHNVSGNNTDTSPDENESTPKPEPNETVSMDVVVHGSAN